MTENVPPVTTAPSSGGATVGLGGPDQPQSRGIPYYEKLRRDLRDTLQKKRLMDKSMAQLEDQIYRFEQSYLEETSAGNIIKGFDNYIKGSSSLSNLSAGALAFMGGSAATSRRKGQVLDQDRVFSRSSANFMRDSPTPSSTHTTPSHAPTPSSSLNGLPSNSNSNGNGLGGNGANNKSGDGSLASGSVKGSGSNNTKNRKRSGGGSSAARDREREDDGDADGSGEGSGSKPPQKRLKVSYGRD